MAPLTGQVPSTQEYACRARGVAHEWQTDWSDYTGALRECRRCRANLREMYFGINVELMDPVPDWQCLPELHEAVRKLLDRPGARMDRGARR